jgi:hypothetical protein
MGRMMTLALALAALATTDDAHACGGCFHQEETNPNQPPQVSMVTSHVMALSISAQQTVLWDQVQFSGAPEDFAWVLPVRPGAYLELGSDAFLETLDAATRPRVSPPPLDCSNDVGCAGRPQSAMRASPGMSAFACSAGEGVAAEGVSDEPPDPVTVVHQGSVGPYETVTLHADVPGVLTTWLQDNGYAIASDVQPVIDDYQAEGFDFIALRLAPDQGEQQMKPVRIVIPGAVVSLPLRMVAAGTGANVALTLFVLGEGRWAARNFPNVAIDPAQLDWDFDFAASNLDALETQLLAEFNNRAWLTSYAYPHTLLSPVSNPVNLLPTRYRVGAIETTTIAAAFAQQALRNGETNDIAGCLEGFVEHAKSDATVAPSCDGTCEVPDNFIDAGELSCGDADDLAVALTGMRPRDVWITRLDANMPRWALAEDLDLEASGSQLRVAHWNLAERSNNAPCPILAENLRLPRPSGAWIGLIVLGGLFAGGIARRASRTRPEK